VNARTLGDQGKRHTRIARPKRPRPLWWLHPVIGALLLGIPLTIIAYLTPESTYHTLYRTPKIVDSEFVVVGLFIYLCFIVGSFFAIGTAKESQEGDTLLYCRWFVRPLFLITLFGYLAWFANGILTSGIGPILTGMHEVLFGQEYGTTDELKSELFPTIPGVTTLTQVGILYVTAEAFLWVWKGSNRRSALIRFAVITLLAVFRSILLGERLALVELVIPVVVVFATTSQLRAHRKNLMRVAPVFLALVVCVLFAFGEYFRSWKFYRPLYHGSYLQFAAERFLGYYTTAINNAAVVYHYEPLHPLRHTFASLFEFPILGSFVSTGYAGVFGDSVVGIYWTLVLLEKYANPEFNNIPMTGLLVNEYSVFLAPVAAFVLGVLSASLYRSFLRGRLIGVLVYPGWFVGILEIPRIYYWAGVRYFPALALLAVTLFAFALAKKSVRTSSGRKIHPDSSRTSRAEILR
jgi:oligosaccharide repeat unit polymerase